MKQTASLADHLAPDTVVQLERAAEIRHDDGVLLVKKERRLGAVYLLGYSVEMCLAAAYFRAAGFSRKMVIDRDTRLQHLARARNVETDTGERLMTSDPHPLVGWARFLEWKRAASKPSDQLRHRLKDAIFKAETVYKHWRPELRYKITDVKPDQAAEVLNASVWFLEQRGRL